MSYNNKTTNNNSSSESNNWRKKPIIDLKDLKPHTTSTDHYNYNSNNHNNVGNSDPVNNYTGYNSYNSNTPYIQPQTQAAVYYQCSEETQTKYSSIKPKNHRYQHANNKRYNHHQNDRSNNDNWRSNATPKQTEYIHPDDINYTKRPNFYNPYMDPVELERGILHGKFYQGIIRITKNRYDAYVTSDGLDSDIYIGGLKSRNRALDGDLVVVQLVDVDPVWDAREERRKGRSQQQQKNDNEIENDVVTQDEEEEISTDQNFKPIYCGEVVGITLRSPSVTFVGTIGASRSCNQPNHVAPGRRNRPPRIAWFRPFNKCAPLIILRDNDVPYDIVENAELYKKSIYSATISHWSIYDTSPAGKLVEEIGPIGDLDAEKRAILSENDILTTDYSPVALIGLPDTPWTIPESEIKKRRDLRHELVFTIDPSTAKDLDDALHFKVLEDGFYEVGVHIADVGYFLKRGSALDEEALQRGTSTYLVDAVATMLPSLLCEELCSLNPNVDRLAFSVIWKMDAYGKQLSTWFGKTVIRSRAKLSYDHAQCVIDGDEIPVEATIYGHHSISQLSASIFMLNKLATELRRKRYDNGSLQLQSVKLKFELDSIGEPISVSPFLTKEANHLIEEFMLCANISVAKKILSCYSEESLLRRHEPPLPKRLDKFIKIAEELGFDFSGSSAGSLQLSFDNVKDKNVKQVFLVLAIRCMQRAKYFCAGNIDISKYSHYALNEPVYTHFTSPIRRYADVMVHRLLESALEGRKFCGYSQKLMQRISFTCNAKKDAARKAQDSSIDLYLSKYLKRYEAVNGTIFLKALVINVFKDYYEIYVPKYGLEDRFYLKDLPIQHYEYKNRTLDINWKQGVPVPMYNERNRFTVETDDDDDNDEDNEQELETLMSALTMLNNDQIVPAVVLEEDTCLQQLAIFSEIDVRIQVNDNRFPPIINVYPVNPFSGENLV